MSVISNRYEFVYLFDVTNGNPNGDPDAGNMPRLDPETNRGLVTDVCLKRKIRNFVQISGKSQSNIFVQERVPLNPIIANACEAVGLEAFRKGNGWDKKKAKGRSVKDIELAQQWLCKEFFDIRTFGAVMSTGPNAGQIRGPVQIAFATSIDPVFAQEVTITRITDVDKEEGEMGRKYIVPYGLYRVHGYVSAKLAERTGFSETDLELLWQSLINMFEHDRSAARGEMVARQLIVFKHDSDMGNAPAHKLFESVKVKRISGEQDTPARAFTDYQISVNEDDIPVGVKLTSMLQ